MKKLIIISALTLFSSCSKQVNFEKLLPQAFSYPVDYVSSALSNHSLSDYFPDLVNVDSITCMNADVLFSPTQSDSFCIESSQKKPFYVLDIWKQDARTSLILIDSSFVSDNEPLFITSCLDNREKLNMKSNEKVDQWIVSWQNVEIPSSFLDISDKAIVIPIPDNARWIERSVIRVVAFSKGKLSNQSFVYLSGDHLSKDIDLEKRNYPCVPLFTRFPEESIRKNHHETIQKLQDSRLEWSICDEYTLLDDAEMLVYVRTYMGESSFFAFNKTSTPVNNQIVIPENIRVGNLKTYFDQSIKQTGDKIVINLSAGSYEIATTEIY